MSAQPIPAPGDIARVRYPFLREAVTLCNEEGYYDTRSWRPGCEYETRDAYGDFEGRTYAVAHGEGEMVLSVVAVFKPGRFPTRVFYTRQWVSPDGKTFGKTGLHIATVEKFRRLSDGYIQPYEIVPDDMPEPPARQPEPALPVPQDTAPWDEDLPF